jgi:hypothetical protein
MMKLGSRTFDRDARACVGRYRETAVAIDKWICKMMKVDYRIHPNQLNQRVSLVSSPIGADTMSDQRYPTLIGLLFDLRLTN